jgi:hypothetical protein
MTASLAVAFMLMMPDGPTSLMPTKRLNLCGSRSGAVVMLDARPCFFLRGGGDATTGDDRRKRPPVDPSGLRRSRDQHVRGLDCDRRIDGFGLLRHAPRPDWTRPTRH